MKLYLRYFAIHMKSQMQYKTSFFVGIMGQFLISFSVFLEIYFMFDRFNEVDGYTYTEVLLCFAVILMSFSTAECLARGFDTFPSMIGNGEFDRIMVRPRNEIFQVLGSKVEFSRLGRFAQSVIVFAYALPTCGVSWTRDKILTLALMIVMGVVVFSSLFLVYAALSFFTTEGLEFMNIFTDGMREFGKYPFAIYGETVLKILTFVIPAALFQYYPFLYLIGRTDNALYAVVPLFAVLFMIPCYAIWRIGMRRYTSTGS
jgi:ABC-type uncharacterized transport system, permease component